jgi:hypothetical protein
MSWLFSRALVEEFSRATCWDGEPSAQLNVTPTARLFWRNDKPMDLSRPSLFGLTLQHLTADHGEALLTWFRAASRARTSALRDLVTGSTENAADYGWKWPGSFARYDRASRTWKTRQCSLLEDSTEFSETWPSSGWMRDGECLEQTIAEPCTSVSESGLLPTPVAIDTGCRFNRSASAGAKLRPTLGAMAKYNLWPTPTVKGNYNRKGLSSKSGDGLATAVQKWPTPTARDYRGVHRTERGRERRLESARGIPLNEAAGGLLNPTWVEWLMGWPIGWTALEPLATARFREWQQQHGGY